MVLSSLPKVTPWDWGWDIPSCCFPFALGFLSHCHDDVSMEVFFVYALLYLFRAILLIASSSTAPLWLTQHVFCIPPFNNFLVVLQYFMLICCYLDCHVKCRMPNEI